MKSRMVCPKCGKPLTAAITRVKDENGDEQRRVRYHCQDRSCDGEVATPSEFRAFAPPVPEVTPLGRWLAAHRTRSWTPFGGQSPALGGGFAILAVRARR